MLKGVLEGSILEIISRKTTYGYDITQQLRKMGFEDVVEGTVYTILVRLEKNGSVKTEKKTIRSWPPTKILFAHTYWHSRAEKLLGEMGFCYLKNK